MNLIVCGILTTLAVFYCVVAGETLGFNMLMCVMCVVALASVWSQDNNKLSEAAEAGDKNDESEPAGQAYNEKKQS